jgi:hypothetical protein
VLLDNESTKEAQELRKAIFTRSSKLTVPENIEEVK